MKLIYENKLQSAEDVKDFVLEGKAGISFPEGKMRLESILSPEQGQKANYVFWCDRDFPKDVQIEWDFRPITEPGLAMIFLAAKGIGGEDLFDRSLTERTGEYSQYHHGDINAFHISYFRRKEKDERQFHTCNLRKSYGFYLVAQGADPIPDAADAAESYHLKAVKKGNELAFYVNDLKVFEFVDDGKTYGPILEGGKIGFRQLAPMVGEYSDLKVYELD